MVQVRDLESKLAELIGTQSAICTGSGTTALIAVLKSIKRDSKDQVIVPGYMCNKVALAVYLAGMIPRFADVDPVFFTIDPKSVEKLINSRTVAVIPVHTFGYSYDVSSIMNLCTNSKITVIEDFCHSFGGKIKENYHGNFGHVSITSFGKGKIIDLNGGAIFTNDKVIKQKVISLLENIGNQNKFLDLDKFISKFEDFYLSRLTEKTGYNFQILFPLILRFIYNLDKNLVIYRMSNSTAKDILYEIASLESNKFQRCKNAELYDKFITTPKVRKADVRKGSGVFMYYSFVLKNSNRDNLWNYLKKYNNNYISSRYVRKAFVKNYSNTFGSKDVIPISNYISKNIVNMVVYPNQSSKDIAERAIRINNIIERMRI